MITKSHKNHITSGFAIHEIIDEILNEILATST